MYDTDRMDGGWMTLGGNYYEDKVRAKDNTMAEHGFLQPNPILFDLETRKPKPVLGHELGLGAKCSNVAKTVLAFSCTFGERFVRTAGVVR